MRKNELLTYTTTCLSLKYYVKWNSQTQTTYCMIIQYYGKGKTIESIKKDQWLIEDATKEEGWIGEEQGIF